MSGLSVRTTTRSGTAVGVTVQGCEAGPCLTLTRAGPVGASPPIQLAPVSAKAPSACAAGVRLTVTRLSDGSLSTTYQGPSPSPSPCRWPTVKK